MYAMDEKIIPLSKPSLDQLLHLKSSHRLWGDDLHYRALFEQTGECVFIIGLDFRYLAANHQALSLLGFSRILR